MVHPGTANGATPPGDVGPDVTPSADTWPKVVGLVREHYAELYRYAFRLSGQAADAEDLTQQTFMIAQRKLDQLQDSSKVRSWLFAILRSCYLKIRRKRVPDLASPVDLEYLAEEPELGEGVDAERLQLALDELPDEFKLVVVMFYFEECSYKEIAAALDVPMGTVMSRLARAKSHLRRNLLKSELRT